MTRERLLELREPLLLAQPLDRQDVAPVRVGGEQAAGADGLAVEQHGARAAHLHLAGGLRALQVEAIAQEVEQQLLRLDLAHDRCAVDRELQVHAPRPDGAASRRSRRRVQADQYSSTKRSWYLSGDHLARPVAARSGAASRASARCSAAGSRARASAPSARPRARSCRPRAHRGSAGRARARSPSASRDGVPPPASVIRSGVSSKTATPSENSTESCVSISSVAPVAANAVAKGGCPCTTAPDVRAAPCRPRCAAPPRGASRASAAPRRGEVELDHVVRVDLVERDALALDVDEVVSRRPAR